MSAEVEPQRARPIAQALGDLVDPERDVDPDAQYRPALLGPRLHENSRDLAAIYQDVVGPFDPRRRAADLGDGDPGDKREERRRLTDQP